MSQAYVPEDTLVHIARCTALTSLSIQYHGVTIKGPLTGQFSDDHVPPTRLMRTIPALAPCVMLQEVRIHADSHWVRDNDDYAIDMVTAEWVLEQLLPGKQSLKEVSMLQPL
jgi:hypothetical protein